MRGSINAFVRGSINAFVRGSINAEWRESVARNSATLAGPRAGYSKNGGHYTQQQDSSPQRRHAACCRGADGRGYPLQGSTPQQKQQQRWPFRRFGTRGLCKMVSDGGGRFIHAHVVGVHTLSLLISSRVAHDRATGDNYTQEGKTARNGTRNGTTRGYST